jgi:hypothetical protein
MQIPTAPSRTETDKSKPLASYVLRVRGRPASLRYELLDLRTGERHVFHRTDSVTTFLRKNGLPDDDITPAYGVRG